MTAPLAGRSAVVTGASRGIGLATARALVAAGARVALIARSGDPLTSAANALGSAALAVTCDVTDPAELARAAERIARELGGAADIVVNNAGIFAPRPLADTSPTEFANTVRVNLVAPFAVVHAFLPAMRERGTGHIVTLGSIADLVAYPENAAYSASKFGLRGLHEVMRAELRGTGVRATLVAPGPTDTPVWDAVLRAGPGRFPERAAMLPADAVAAAVLYAVTQPARVNIDELRLSAT